MLHAANAGDRSSMLYMAKAYETGENLGINRYTSSFIVTFRFSQLHKQSEQILKPCICDIPGPRAMLRQYTGMRKLMMLMMMMMMLVSLMVLCAHLSTSSKQRWQKCTWREDLNLTKTQAMQVNSHKPSF